MDLEAPEKARPSAAVWEAVQVTPCIAVAVKVWDCSRPCNEHALIAVLG